MKQDFRDLLLCFEKHNVEYMVVGAQAMSVFGYTRATGDLDIFLQVSEVNSHKVIDALKEFGAPLAAHKITPAFFQHIGVNYQIGIPPSRIDILTQIDGMDYDEADLTKERGNLGGILVPVLSLQSLIKNKEACGRDKDLIDIKELRKLNR